MDRFFYDTPRTARIAEYDIAARELPSGWRRNTTDEWTIYVPPVNRTPAQGWKVHVSGCAESAEQVMDRVWDYCTAAGISFKHLRGPSTLLVRNAKYAARGASGKLVTLYPADVAELERVLAELGPLVAGLPGPYILSDLRIGDGPLYVRYGGILERHCVNERGEVVPALENGDGELVPDRRDPVFTVPPWVPLPSCLEPHLAARAQTTTADLPYRVEKALHFSNGGGVYVATDGRTDEKVILKEARPHAGLTADGADAVARLQRERDMLTRLAGIDGVPAVRDYFTLGEHHFLVEEFIEGRPLNTFFAERYPLVDPEPEPGQVAGYTAWALRVLDGVERVVAAIHERDVVVNDLHMFNVMVRPDDSIALIDFEVAALPAEERRQTLANPAFVAPRDRTGFEVDRYSLACLRLALFMPMTMLLVFDRGKACQFAELIAGHFPVTRKFLDQAVLEITRGVEPQREPVLDPDRADWADTRAALGRAILAGATPDRTDRLFPGDPAQFGPGALGLAHGAAGVLYAMDATGVGRHPEYEEWLIRRAVEPHEGTGLGLYDGLLGAAYVLGEFGHTAEALKVAEICLGERWERLGLDLYGGLPGMALVLDRLAAVTGEGSLRDAARQAAALAVSRWQGEDDRSTRPGLLYGSSGLALMLLRLYDRTKDDALLDLAETALRQDLDGCVTDRNGALQVDDDGHRKLPYLRRGSIGVGIVLDDYLALRDDERLSRSQAAIRLAAMSPYYAQSGLFSGRAGMILYLSRQDRAEPWVGRHIRYLAWHALAYQGGLAFPGDQLYRLSMDLATGTAGVLLALGAALHDQPVHLPFLEAAHSLPAEPSSGTTSIQPERG